MLIDPAITYTISRRDSSLQGYRNNPNLVQPSNAEVESLFEMGEVYRTLPDDGVYPDVYAAACAFKAGHLFNPNTEDCRKHGVGFRGMRDEKWPLVPSILRGLPLNNTQAEIEECKRRYKDLALFCEAMKQLLDQKGEDSSESVCIAIAQHYGILSPLIDLTRTAWVALFFASQEGKDGDIGIVQCFFLSELEELFQVDNASFGDFHIVQADFVTRIKNQKGFFLRLPGHRLDKQNVPFTVRFKQHEGLLFEDEDLKVTNSHLYPSADSDPFAPFADPQLKTYPAVIATRPTSPEEYFSFAERVFIERNLVMDILIEMIVRRTCDFHYRLQFVDGLNDVARSLNRLKNAIQTIRIAQEEKRPLNFNNVINTYQSHSTSENWPLILNTASRQQRSLSLEFKQKVASLMLDHCLTIRQASMALSFNESTIRRWLRQLTEVRKDAS